MIGLGDYGVVAVPRDNVHSLPECKGASKLGASFETPCGRLLVSFQSFTFHEGFIFDTHLYIGLVWKDLFEFIYCHLQFERAYGNNCCHVHELFSAYFQKQYTLAYENYL